MTLLLFSAPQKGLAVLRLTRDPKTSTRRITFAIPADAASGNVSVVGDFNDWTPGRNVLRRRSNGTPSAAVPVPAGATLRFRYLGENGVWFDDPEADFIDPHGSVVKIPA